MIKTDIILNGRFLELTNDVSMPFTYQIADVKDPSKKNTNFSKTITLPGTRINNDVFGYIWDTNVSINSSGSVNFTPSFNPNKKADVVILYDGAEIFKGFMKLDRIKVLSDYRIEYDVTCFGKLKDLFLELGEQTLADLNLSKYNHNYTMDIQRASLNNYIYKNGVTVPFNKGDGYVYPFIDYALNNNIDWKTEHFFPAVYYKTLIHEIITQAGFKYDGAIFNDNDFKSLIVCYGSGTLKLSTNQISNRTFRASNTSNQAITNISSANPSIAPHTLIDFQDDTTPPNNDAGNAWNTTLYKFTAPISGTYKFNADIFFNLEHLPNSSGVNPNVQPISIGWFTIYKNGLQTGIYEVFFETATIVPAVSTSTLNNNFMIYYGGISIAKYSYSPNFNFVFEQSLILNQNDYIELRFETAIGLGYKGLNLVNIYQEDPLSVTSSATMRILTGSSFSNEMVNVSVAEGDSVDMSSIFANTVKQKDFISSFFKLFNIYTETDKEDTNLLHFETRTDFYATSGTIRNWDDKLDYSQNYEVIPMGDLDARTYLFKFKDDNDYWNAFYKKKYQETYGQKKYEVDNDWLININTNEVIFAPTPLVDRPNDDKIIPRIINVDNNGQPIPASSNGNKAVNLRLLYYGGVKNTFNSYNHITSSGTHTYSNYGYAGHLDNIQFPNYDVNFGVPIEVYYTATTYTNNNIFNKYYKQFITEITSKDSQIFKGQFHLNALDIALLNFRDLFYFHGNYWILNKIYDYNPIEQNKTTTCEFLKLKGGVPFVASSGTTNGGSGKPLDDDDIFPVGNDSIPRDGNLFDGNILISGSDNIVNSTVSDALIVGSNNIINGGSQKVTLINSSGTIVYPNSQRVTLINSNDYIVRSTYSGKTIINGTIYGQKQIIWSSGTTYTLSGNESGALVLFEISSDTSCYLPFPADIENGYTIEIKNANNTAKQVTVSIQSDSVIPTWAPGDSTDPVDYKLNAGEFNFFTYYNEFWYVH
jgi:hypothetical protein